MGPTVHERLQWCHESQARPVSVPALMAGKAGAEGHGSQPMEPAHVSDLLKAAACTQMPSLGAASSCGQQVGRVPPYSSRMASGPSCRMFASSICLYTSATPSLEVSDVSAVAPMPRAFSPSVWSCATADSWAHHHGISRHFSPRDFGSRNWSCATADSSAHHHGTLRTSLLRWLQDPPRPAKRDGPRAMRCTAVTA